MGKGNDSRKKEGETLILALACGATVEAAARQCQVGESTVYRRLRDPAFRARVQEARAEMVKRSAGMLTAAAGESVRTLLSLQKESVPAAVRLGAARAVLEIGIKIRELVDLESRIAALESRAGMDAGAAVYWPSRWPLVALMRRRAEIGAAAFDTEYQGVPSVEGLTEFPAVYFDRPELWFDDWPDGLVYRVQSLDPSKGADAKSGDFQAHVLLGMDGRGTMFVEGVLAREPIPQMIARAMDLAAGFGPLTSLAVESNDALGMLVGAFEDAFRARSRLVPLESIINTLPKVVRVRRLGLYFGRSQVRLRNTRGTRMLVDQLRDFPAGDFDDGPDALALAVRRLELLTNPS